MPDTQHPHLDIADLALVGPDEHPVRLAELTGVNVLVLMRHRH